MEEENEMTKKDIIIVILVFTVVTIAIFTCTKIECLGTAPGADLTCFTLKTLMNAYLKERFSLIAKIESMVSEIYRQSWAAINNATI